MTLLDSKIDHKNKKKRRIILNPRDKEWDLGAFIYNCFAFFVIIAGSCYAVYFIMQVWSFLTHHHC
jgi:hypothetical protein